MKAPAFWRHRTWVSDFLLPFSWLYQGLMWARRVMLNTPPRVNVPVICVGNVVMGGAGKTPVTLALIDIARQWGYVPHVLTRGYKGRLNGPLQVDLTHHTALDVGDEPLLLAEKAPTWIGANRYDSACAAIGAGATLLIMDDGLQNLTLHQDYKLVVMNAEQGVGNGCLFPAGPLRETLRGAFKRVDGIVWIGEPPCPFALKDGPLVITATRHVIPLDPEITACVAFAGIATPEKVRKTLETQGVAVVSFHSFADHHVYTDAQINDLKAEARQWGVPLITTTKDFARLTPAQRVGVTIVSITLVLSEHIQQLRPKS